MIKRIVGGAIVLIIGGTTYTVSQSDVTDNFSKNTGLNQQQAQQYINNIPKSDITSFTKAGQQLVSDGNYIVNQLSASIDCINYSYQWETSSLSCDDGKNQLQQIGADEITLGNCYEALDTSLGDSANSKMNECISDIDTVDSDYNFPIVTSNLDDKTVNDERNINLYNKSLIQAALNSK